MDKKKLIELLDSWENIEIVTQEICNNPAYFQVLLSVALFDKEKKSWRAAYLVDKIHDVKPEMVQPFLGEMILQLKEERNSSKKRHFLKLVSMNSIPNEHLGFLVDYCLSALQSAKEPPAVRVHAMQILYNISDGEPDLKPEILSVIEHEMKYHSTAGILSRGSKLVRKLRKQIS